MLSRTADHLYWLARYVERAENTARLMDVTTRMAMLPQTPALTEQNWGAVLSTTGLSLPYLKRHGGLHPAAVLHFMALDGDNPSSLLSVVRSARENAHAVRGALTAEMWESLNSTWLDLKAMGDEHLEGDLLPRFFDWVKSRALLFRGITEATLLRDEAWQFIELGRHVERADNTARLVDVKYHILLPSADEVGGAGDYYQWGALLKAVSAFENYRKVYRDALTPLRVAELLLLNADLPRSLHACLNAVQAAIHGLAPNGEAARQAGDLHAHLHFARIDLIFSDGLHEWLDDVLARLSTLHGQIGREFLLPAPQPEYA
mgnify:CR=1 FL=1